MADAGEHTKRDETPDWWLRQIEDAQKLYKERVSQEHYRPQLRSVFKLKAPNYFVTQRGADEGTFLGDGAKPGDQVDLLYLPRWKEWLRSQAYDSTPEILAPQSGGDGNEITAEMVSELQERVGYEAGEWEEWRGTVDDYAENGAFAIWYGIHTEVPDEASLAAIGLSAGSAVDAVLSAMMEGETYEALPGQDHETIAGALENAAMDPETLLAPNGEQVVDALHEAALAHRKMAERESKNPHEIGFERAAIWVQRRPVGTCTVWDSQCDDVRDARWVARKVVIDVDVARKHPGFKRDVRGDIQPGTYSTKDGWRGEILADSTAGELPGSDRPASSTVRSSKAVLWQIWDRKYREVRWIQPGMDRFLERSTASPFVGIPGFVPAVIEAPTKHNDADPTRPYGIPGAAIAWPIQREIIKLASYDLELVKKISSRTFEAHPDADPSEIQALAAGVPGAIVTAPSGVMPGGTIAPTNWGTVPPEVFHRLQAAIQRMSELLAWPLSQMTGAPQADTATGEEVAVSAGLSQVGDFIRVTQDAMSKGQRIKAALMRQFYTPEQVGQLVGLKYVTGNEQTGEPSAWDMWRQADPAGDRYSVRVASTAQNEDPIRRNQVREGLDMLMQLPGPAPGLPLFSTEKLIPLLREYFKTLGLELPDPTEYSPEQLQQAMASAVASQAPKPSAGGDTPKRGGKPDRRPVRGDLAPSA